MSYLELVVSVLPSLLISIPVILAWLVGIALAARMLVRGGGKTERLLLAGCILMLSTQIARPFLTALSIRLISEHGITAAGVAGLVVSLPNSILGMAGIACLILAFWFRWKSSGTTQSTDAIV